MPKQTATITLGWPSRVKKNHEKAEVHYFKAMEADPRDPRDPRNLGNLYLDLKRPGEADRG